MTPSSSGLRLVFAGTPEFAAHHLQALVEDGRHELVAVYTQPDRPAGRGKKLTPSPVKKLALQHELAVFQPQSLKDSEVQRELAEHRADVMIVVAYGLLLPQAVLDIPRFACLNVHGSLLPRWRGAAPIQRAIAAGDKESGVTIMQMDKGLDTGAMLLKSTCTIADGETSASLHDKLMHLGAPALLETLEQIQKNELSPELQDDTKATYAEKISKAEAQINWSETAREIETKIRAYNPFPIAYTFLNGSRIKIYQASFVKEISIKEANIKEKNITQYKQVGEIVRVDTNGVLVACAEDYLLLEQCQLPNKKLMPIAAIINGNSDIFAPGACFE